MRNIFVKDFMIECMYGPNTVPSKYQAADSDNSRCD